MLTHKIIKFEEKVYTPPTSFITPQAARVQYVKTQDELDRHIIESGFQEGDVLYLGTHTHHLTTVSGLYVVLYIERDIEVIKKNNNLEIYPRCMHTLALSGYLYRNSSWEPHSWNNIKGYVRITDAEYKKLVDHDYVQDYIQEWRQRLGYIKGADSGTSVPQGSQESPQTD